MIDVILFLLFVIGSGGIIFTLVQIIFNKMFKNEKNRKKQLLIFAGLLVLSLVGIVNLPGEEKDIVAEKEVIEEAEVIEVEDNSSEKAKEFIDKKIEEDKKIKEISEITDKVIEKIREELPNHVNEDMTIENVSVEDKTIIVNAIFSYAGEEALKSPSFEVNISSITDYLLKYNLFEKYVIDTNELDFTFKDSEKVVGEFGSYFDIVDIANKSMEHFKE